MRKEIRNAVIVGLAVTFPLITAAPAMATGVTSCPSDGNPGGGQRCTTLSNGVLSVRGSSTYAAVNYYRKSGGSLTGRIGWERNGANTWDSYQDMSAAPFHYFKQWSTSKSCSPLVGKLNAGGSTYATPPLPSC
jgi:hypothetical protein